MEEKPKRKRKNSDKNMLADFRKYINQLPEDEHARAVRLIIMLTLLVVAIIAQVIVQVLGLNNAEPAQFKSYIDALLHYGSVAVGIGIGLGLAGAIIRYYLK